MSRQKLNPFFVFVLIYLFDVGLTVLLNSDYFYKVAKINYGMQYSRKAFEATSPLHCARKCQLQKCASFSFSNHVCSIGKDAHLYTLKTMDKLKWLQAYYKRTKIWIGLNDIDFEGTYRWEDNYTVCSQSWIKQIFAPGEPNNRKSIPNGEDCIHFYQNVPLLNDANCLTNYTYICEKPFFFNFH